MKKTNNTCLFFVLLFSFFTGVSCKKKNSIPSVTTSEVIDITGVDATSGGNVTSDGSSPIIARGVIWSKSPKPTVSLVTKTIEKGDLGVFKSELKNLEKNTKYFLRAYATNAEGTAYGEEFNFSTNSTNLFEGLIVYYPFSGNLRDTTKNMYNGISNGGSFTEDRFGTVKSAYSFNSGSNIICTNNTFTPPNELSYSLWVKANSIIGGRGMVVNFSSGECSNGIFWDRALSIENGRIVFYTFPLQLNSANVNLLDMKWHHLAVTMNNSGSKIYIDGLEKAKNISQVSGGNFSGSFKIGSNGPTSTEYSMIGSYDDIRIYNRALLAEEVQFLSKK